MIMKSEFGKGLTYCLALFLKHAERDIFVKNFEVLNKMHYTLWFYGASDHFYGLEIPKTLPKNIQNRLYDLKAKVMYWGGRTQFHNLKVTKKEFDWAINEALFLLRAIDRHYGVNAGKGQWE